MAGMILNPYLMHKAYVVCNTMFLKLCVLPILTTSNTSSLLPYITCCRVAGPSGSQKTAV